ncbi:MAG TPA: hypothetical protein VFM05_00735 [Candidatus Saccharimonadales bacterium]|nr:hypothetical protein [Candidatus Saccharimonadales bacterium]
MEQFHKLSQGSKTVLSEMKSVDVAVYNYLKTVADASVQAGVSTGTLQNGGVDWPLSMTGTARFQPI